MFANLLPEHAVGSARRTGTALVLVALVLTGCGFRSSAQNAAGVKLYQSGQYLPAAQQFQKAMATDPKNADSYYNLASVYHRLGTMNGRQADLDQAEALYHQCLDRNPNHRDCYRALAVLLVEEGRSEQAFRLLEGWAMRSPTIADARIELARLSEEAGNYQAAKEYLVESLTIEPNNARALAALGHLQEISGNASQALANYERSLRSNSAQPEVAARVASLRSAMNSSIYGQQPVTSPGNILR